MLSPALTRLLATTAHHALTRAEFDALDLPGGTDRAAVWDELWQAREAQAIHYRDVETVGGEAVNEWYTPTWSIGYKLRVLEEKTRTSSPLDRALSERFGRRFVAQPLIDETVAAAACDGIDVRPETVRDLASGAYAPADDAERVVANVHRLLSDVVVAPVRPVTPASIEDMYRRLVRGVDEGALTTGVPWGMEWPIDPVGRAQALDEVCALASGRLADPYEHPVVVAQRVCCKFWKTSPFPCCNYLLGSVVMRQALKNAGYPVFAWVPSSRLTLDWKSGGRSGGDVYPYAEAGVIRPLDWDWTPYWESCLALLVEDVEQLEAYVLDLKRRDEGLLEQVRADRTLNHRQQDVVARAVVAPDDEVRIAQHQRAWGLAYSTARSDLAALVELGLFQMRYESKAQVFSARPDLKNVLARRYAGCGGRARG